MSATGALIVRAWHDVPDGSLRARVRATSDVTLGTSTYIAAGSADELHRLLDRWLASLDRDHSPNEPGREQIEPS
jgi:hypothetical protein